MQYLVDQASISAKNQSEVDKFVAIKLHEKWKQSNSHNTYKPFRELLADRLYRIQSIEYAKITLSSKAFV